ncbi:hypothetical protein [Methylocucumis oryzae]|uniref:hypothetical protein n=1 Tax=Methylocucumis oryzae TaxID=1632867 RepID=UPI000A55D61A|nr:hypothetical protein [Methylocucumis oryzae]
MSEQPPGNSIIPNISNAVANNPIVADAQQVLATETETHPALKKLSNLTLARQLGLMLVLAISVAMGVAVVLWSQAPSYDRLYVDVSDEDMADILDYLNSQNIKYKIEPGSGAIMVLSGKASEIKLKLAGQGLPRSKPIPGYDLLDKEQNIGTSKKCRNDAFPARVRR